MSTLRKKKPQRNLLSSSLGAMFWRRSSLSPPAPPAAPPARLLVIQSDKYCWPALFEGQKLPDGRSIEVLQTGWDGLRVLAEPQSAQPLVCYCVPVDGDPTDQSKRPTKRTKCVTFKPDFVLVRNEVFTPFGDYRNQLFGLMYGGVQGVNSLQSLALFAERALIGAELQRLNKELGPEAFPVVPQCFFAGHEEMMYTQEFPAVLKVGAAHAGMGKAKVLDHHAMADMRSLLAVSGGRYATAERFIESAHEFRVQKIGARIRAFKRVGVSGDWKTNTGSAMLEELEPSAAQRAWAEHAASLFGQTLDILTVDTIVEEATGKEWILEVNGTSSGLSPDTEAQDNRDIRDLVVARMSAALCCVAVTKMAEEATDGDGVP